MTTTNLTDAQRTFGFRVAHAAFRRDACRLVRAVPRIRAADDAAAVARWFERVAGILVHHHEIEDEIWWPLLAGAVDGFAERQAVMVDEHDRLVEAIRATRAALADLAAAAPAERPDARRRAAARAATFAQTVTGHLDAEEAAVFPVLSTVDPAVVAEAEERTAKADSFSTVRWALPWALDDAAPELEEEITATLPGVARLLLRRWDRRYRRDTAAVVALSAVVAEEVTVR